jgi:hypothetical protein
LRATQEFAPIIAAAEADGTDPFGDALGSMSFARLPDSVAVQVLPLLNETMAHLPQDSCGTILSNSSTMTGDGFLELLGKMDHPTLQHWFGLIELIFLSNARGDTAQPRSSPSDAQAVMLRMLLAMRPDDRDRFMRALDGTDSREQCWAYQALFSGVSALPMEDQLVIVHSALN